MLTCHSVRGIPQDPSWQYQQLSSDGLFDNVMHRSSGWTDDNSTDLRLSKMVSPLLDAGGPAGMLETGVGFTNPPPYLPTQYETWAPQTANSEQVRDHDATRAAVVERLSMPSPDTIPGCAQPTLLPPSRGHSTRVYEILEAHFSSPSGPGTIDELVKETGLNVNQIMVSSNQTRRDILSI